MNVLAKYAPTIEKRLGELVALPDAPDGLKEAMAYSLMAGGKRLRPALTIMGSALLGGRTEECLNLACAVEMIHTYSLIHDDLPAMDNDVLRRGKPTSHVAFGEGNAILAGDALLNYAFEVMLDNARRFPLNLRNHINAMRRVARAAGPSGMIAGQHSDLEHENKPMGVAELNYIHAHKTGALITGSLLAGLALNSPERAHENALKEYGDRIGLVFQIVDDVLDVTGDQASMDKTLGKDERSGKLTFVKLYGVEGSMDRAKRLTYEAREALSVFDVDKRGELDSLALLLLSRAN